MIHSMKRHLLMGVWLLLFFTLSGCSQQEADPIGIYLDVPVNGISLPLAPVNIEGHTVGNRITQVEIWVNDAAVATVPVEPGENTLSYFTYQWLPEENGEYTLSVFPMSSDSRIGSPDTARITINSTSIPLITPSVTPTNTPTATFTPEISLTPTDILTPSATSTPLALVNFWAEPSELNAGECTSIRWHAENVTSLIFGRVRTTSGWFLRGLFMYNPALLPDR